MLSFHLDGMKILFFTLLSSLILSGCGQNNSSSNQEELPPEPVLSFYATDEVLMGKGDFGTPTSPKTISLSIKNEGTTDLVGPLVLDDTTNFSLIYNSGCTTVKPKGTACTAKVSFNPAGKADGVYTTRLNLDRVFVTLTATVSAPAPTTGVEFKVNSAVVTTIDFGVLTDLVQVTKVLTIKNLGSQTLTAPISLSSSDYTLTTDGCSNKPIAPAGTCTVRVILDGRGKSGLIQSTLTYGVGSIPLTGTVNSTVTGNVEYLNGAVVIEEMDFGTYEPGRTDYRSISIKNKGLIPVNYPVVLTGTGYSITFDSCSNKPIAAGAQCQVKVVFQGPVTEGDYLGSISYNSVELDLKAKVEIPEPPQVTKIALTNYSPNTGLIDFGSVEQYSGDTVVKTMAIRNLSGSIQKFTVPPTLNNFIITDNKCLNVNIGKSSFCNISVKFNANKPIQAYEETFLMENDTHKIEFQLKANVITSSSIVPCDMTNSVAGGGVNNTNGAVVAVEGNFPVCTVKTCQALYNVAGDLKSCEPVIVACTAIEATANGVNFTNSNNSVKGNVVAGNITECLLADNACNVNYLRNVSGKVCNEEVRACTQADAIANSVNIANVDLTANPAFLGNVVAGNPTACIINQCNINYTKDGASKNCIANSRACVASDVTGLGGNITNALTYSGQVILTDASACKIATCTAPFEPSASGLICESKAMSGLGFTIANKNTNGYIKDDFAQLNITAVNALEMKISDGNTCANGTWEEFNTSKQFTIPANRLNVLADAYISIQFRRNATLSSCIYVPGALTLATSHLYRHDNVAPVVSITSHTENQLVSGTGLYFTGACTSGINPQTGLNGQTLTAVSCSGAYTSSLISMPTDGIYALYITQTDLAGNIGEATRNVKKATACNSANALAGGVRSLYGALTYNGNTIDGCTIATCNTTYTTLATDAKECEPKDITGGSFIIGKNGNGYLNNTSVPLNTISATNAATMDIFESANCSGTAKASNVTYAATYSYTASASTFNAAADQPVSILFKMVVKLNVFITQDHLR